MCLYEVVSLKTRNPKFRLNRDKHGWYGWKVYEAGTKKFMYPMNYGTYQTVGEWIDADDCRPPCNIVILDDDCFSYPSGFHVYVKRPLYYKSQIRRKVYIKQIIAKGFEYDGHHMPTIICKKIFIPKLPVRKKE
jgi:hypothetical protein